MGIRSAFLLLQLGLLAACGGSTNSSPEGPQPPANRPPTITGTPAPITTVGQQYSFTPVANDLDGDALTFSIAPEPSWASFDPGTGSLTGTPGTNDVGTTAAVTISVSDGKASASLAPFNLEVEAIRLGSATISWDIPSTNADGSPMNDLAGYRVHYRDESGTFSRVAVVTEATTDSILVEDLEPGTWFFSVTARDRTGNESAHSQEVSKVVAP